MKKFFAFALLSLCLGSCIFKKIKEKEANYIKTSKAYLNTWYLTESQKCRDSRDSAFAAYSIQLPAYDTIKALNVILKESADRINGECDRCLLALDTLKKTRSAALQLDTKGLIDLPK